MGILDGREGWVGPELYMAIFEERLLQHIEKPSTPKDDIIL